MFIYGDSFKNFIVAMIVVEKDEVLKWAKRTGESDPDDIEA